MRLLNFNCSLQNCLWTGHSSHNKAVLFVQNKQELFPWCTVASAACGLTARSHLNLETLPEVSLAVSCSLSQEKLIHLPEISFSVTQAQFYSHVAKVQRFGDYPESHVFIYVKSSNSSLRKITGFHSYSSVKSSDCLLVTEYPYQRTRFVQKMTSVHQASGEWRDTDENDLHSHLTCLRSPQTNVLEMLPHNL